METGSLPFRLNRVRLLHHRSDSINQVNHLITLNYKKITSLFQNDYGIRGEEIGEKEGCFHHSRSDFEVLPMLPLVFRKVHEIPKQERLHRSGNIRVKT